MGRFTVNDSSRQPFRAGEPSSAGAVPLPARGSCHRSIRGDTSERPNQRAETKMYRESLLMKRLLSMVVMLSACAIAPPPPTASEVSVDPAPGSAASLRVSVGHVAVEVSGGFGLAKGSVMTPLEA